MSRYEYTLSCPCGYENTAPTKKDARLWAKQHIKDCSGDTAEVYIDRYDLVEGELDGEYEVVGKRKTPTGK